MPDFKGYETSNQGAPSHAEGADYTEVPANNLSARGDMPADAPGAPGTQGYRGPAENDRYWDKKTANVSKLGPSS